MRTMGSARRPVNSLIRSPVRSSISTVTRTSIRRAVALRRPQQPGTWPAKGDVTRSRRLLRATAARPARAELRP